MNLGDLMNTKPVTVRPTETVAAAGRRMRDEGVGCVVVTGPTRKPVGILTDRDIVLAVVAEGRLPEAHEKFLRELKLHHVEGQYAFVHAGLSRDALRLSDVHYALGNERPRSLLWQRNTIDLPHNLGVTVVYGHTPMPDMQVRWNLPFSIGIDTGSVYGGKLTAIRLPDETVFQV